MNYKINKSFLGLLVIFACFIMIKGQSAPPNLSLFTVQCKAGEGQNLGTVDGIKIWNDIKKDWITIEVDWGVKTIGWIEK